MKKIFVLFFIFTFVASVKAQTTCGALTTSEVWSSNVHVTCDVTVGNGITLTISPGITVSFDAGASLIINGSGVLIADGTPANNITFTASGTSWGHLSFNNSTASVNSIINYCIIEKGNAIGMAIPYGGGIHANTSKLVISNSSIRNNIADWGGGVFVNKTFSPSISNCKIYLNSATLGGGGMYFWNNSSSVVTNCLIFKNSLSTFGIGGGGVIIGPSAGSVKIINCVIANNTAVNSVAAGIYLYSSNSAAIINSIIWGAPDQLSFFSTATSVMQYCAINGVSYPTCLNLNSDNNQPDGPNFVNPANDDYSIKIISPCRDAGTTPSPALPNDYLGNPRVGPYDIGAYEVQYNAWRTTASSTDWNTAANWTLGVPNSVQDVVIPSGAANYPTGNSSLDFVMGPGKYLILNSGAKATFNSLTNNGTILLHSDATGISSLILNTNVTATVDLFLTGGNPGAPTLKLNKWHFISTPITSLLVSTFAPVPTKNVVGWYDNQVSGSLATGWINYFGYRYSTGVTDGPTFSNLTPGIGYDYYGATDQKYTFSGQLNTSNVTMSLSYNVDDALHGFNLLGNPFSSGLNWDDIVNNVYSPFPISTSKSLYFTRDNAQCSYINGVGIPSDVTGIIPPMQGFFVKTYAAGNAITIPAGARVQGNIHTRYKGIEIIPLVRLSLAEDTLHDETVVRFDTAAKSGPDYDFDAPKMFLSPDILSIYSTSDGSNLAINGLPFPDSLVEIPIVVNLLAAGNNTITATQLQGLDKYNVTLTDNTTGFVANLKTTPVLTFTGTAGTTADRFVLKVAAISTGIENPLVSKSIFNIYDANNMINIQTISDAWEGKKGSVRVLDLSGKTVEVLNNSEFSKNSLIRIESPGSKGIYIVEIKSGALRYVGKVVIK